MFDLHVHSNCSDGDMSPAEVVRAAKQRGITGLALTDHNGLWGVAAARAAAQGLMFISGIELSSLWQDIDVHIIGLGTTLQENTIYHGLARTRRGCAQRIEAMVERCQAAGFKNVSMAAIQASRQTQANYCYISYDVALELQRAHQLHVREAHAVTVKGGAGYVPYGDWALSPPAAVELIHAAGGVAVLAHPGIIAAESSQEMLQAVFAALVAAGLDGLEVFHPFHDAAQRAALQAMAADHELIITGGSDWHGPSRFAANHAQFGRCGVPDSVLPTLQARLAARR